jgi:hypothetical protein
MVWSGTSPRGSYNVEVYLPSRFPGDLYRIALNNETGATPVGFLRVLASAVRLTPVNR